MNVAPAVAAGTLPGPDRGWRDTIDGQADDLVDRESVSLSGRPCDSTGCAIASADP